MPSLLGFGKVGFKVDVSEMDMMTYYEASMNGEYDIIHYRTYGGSFDPFTPITNMDPAVSADPVAVQFAAFLPRMFPSLTAPPMRTV